MTNNSSQAVGQSESPSFDPVLQDLGLDHEAPEFGNISRRISELDALERIAFVRCAQRQLESYRDADRREGIPEATRIQKTRLIARTCESLCDEAREQVGDLRSRFASADAVPLASLGPEGVWMFDAEASRQLKGGLSLIDAQVIAFGVATDYVENLNEVRAAGINVVSPFQLLHERLPSLRWLVQGLISHPSLSFLTGWSESWKTWLLHQLSVSFVRGDKFLGQFQCNRVHETRGNGVLFIQTEEHWTEHYRKARYTVAALGDWRDCPEVGFSIAGLDSVAMPDLRLSDGEQRSLLRAAVKRFKPDLVCVDSLRQSFDGNENESEYAQKVRIAVSEIQAEHPCSFVFIHHWRKASGDSKMNDPGQRGRGTAALRDKADQQFCVEPNPDGTLTFTHEKSRTGEKQKPLRVRFTVDSGRTFVESESIATRPPHACAVAVKQAVQEKGQIRQADLIRELQSKEFTPNKIRDWADKLARGEVESPAPIAREQRQDGAVVYTWAAREGRLL